MNQTRGFTLVELLIVIAIIGIISAIAIPNMLMAMQRSRQKGTMVLMHSIATGIESLKGEVNEELFAKLVPTINSRYLAADAAPFLVPIHLSPHPNFDRWGATFVYHAQETGDWQVWFSSPGRNGIREALESNKHEYQVQKMEDFNFDIIFLDGMMSYGPMTTGKTSS